MDDAGDTDSIKLLDLLESYGLQQQVTGPTHSPDHTLDLIITRQPADQLLKNSPRVGRFISDHAAVLCSIHSTKPSLTARKVSYRKLKSVNIDSLNEDLATSELCQNSSDDLEELVTSDNDTLKAALDKHAHGHMVSNNLYLDTQSAYRRNHSTETALLKVLNGILLNMN